MTVQGIGQSANDNAGRGPLSPRRRLFALLSLCVAVLGVPVVLAGNASANPTVPRLKAVECAGGTYTVVKGDSWYRIAGNLKVGVSALTAANNAALDTWLYPGDVLCIPGGSSGVTTTAATTTTVKPATQTSAATSTTVAAGKVSIRQFPVQGTCYFIDTYGAPRSGGRRHEGVDIMAKTGRLVYAADAGTLTRQYIDAPGSLSGNGWRVTKPDGTYFFYAHLSEFAPGLKLGSKVQAGQILGKVGETGNAGAPHLHFEVHPGGGAATNPYPVVKPLDGCSTSVVPSQPGATTTTSTVKPTTTTVKPTTTTAKPTATTKPTGTTAKPTATTAKPTTTTTVKPATTTTIAASEPPSGAKWQFIAPVMALDTGATGRPLAKGAATTVTVKGLSGVDPSTSGVMVRVLARRMTGAGFVTLHACNAAPSGATLTYAPGRVAATVTTVPVAAGTFCITSTGKVDVRIAVIAQQAVDGVGLQPVAARRAVDTRRTGILAAGGTRSASPSTMGVPSSAKAVTVSITLINPSAAGGFGIGACGGTPWIVNIERGVTQTFSAVVRTNGAGVCMSSSVAVHVVLDVTGAWTGSSGLAARSSSRVYDSRTADSVTSAVLTAVPALPRGATRGQFSVTVIATKAPVAVTVWNCNAARPSGAVAFANANSMGTSTVSLDTSGGALCMSSTSSARVLLDLVAVG